MPRSVADDRAPVEARPLEDEAEDLYEAAPCGYVSTLPDGTIARVNRTFLAWTGYAPEDLVGRRRMQELLAPGDRIYYETHYAPLLRMQGSVNGIAVELLAADGRRLPALIASTVRLDASGEPVRIRTAVLDATDRRAYERELLHEKRRAEASEARARLLAQTLQESLIPPTPPRIPGLDVGAAYRPAGLGDEVGGDFYDVFETRGSVWGVVLGDVAGKGAPAAVVTALARYTLRAAVMQHEDPRSVLTVLNEALLREDVERPCATIFASVLPPAGPDATATVSMSIAGNPLPVLVTEEGVTQVGRPGTILGVLEDPPLEVFSVTLPPGGALVLFTDGITEGRNGAEWYGDGRLVDLLGSLRRRTAGEMSAAVVEDVVAFQDGHPRDDIAVVVLSAPRAP